MNAVGEKIRLKGIALTLVMALLLGLSLVTTTAMASGHVNELTGTWAEGTPDAVRNGEVLVSEWRMNLNDAAAAPSNEPVDNVTFTARATGGVFKELPESCVIDGANPESSLSEDNKTLICNLGTQDLGTALALQVAVIADGTGDVSIDATFQDQDASLDSIALSEAFAMDMRWSTPSTYAGYGNNYVDTNFQWTLSLGDGSPRGPDTIVYDLNIAAGNGAALSVGPDTCAAFTSGTAEGHPWSGGDHPADQKAPSVESCKLTQTGPNTFELELSGIDYSLTQVPTKDSAGKSLPTSSDVIASGAIWIRVAGAQNNTLTLTANAPTYVAENGEEATDNAANNTATKTWTRGGWTSAWQTNFTGPTSADWWADQYRVSAGMTVQSVVTSRLPAEQQTTGMCQAVDTRYADFERASLDIAWHGTPVPGVQVEYYTGNTPVLNPESGDYDPSKFNCNIASGWSTTAPSDLTQVKAVRVQFPSELANEYPYMVFPMATTIHDDVEVGQDIWMFGWLRTGDTWSTYPDEMPPGTGVYTEDARYPFTANGRDILRIVGLMPTLQKSTSTQVITPGEPAEFQLDYAAEGSGAVSSVVDGYTIVDTLPAGMTYQAGSAYPEPDITIQQGRQVLTWNLDGVETNEIHSLTYQVNVDSSVEAGEVLVNEAIATYDTRNSKPAQAQVTMTPVGKTMIGKSADQDLIPNVDGQGAGSGSWTVTLRSADPETQAFTDVIDILPYVGDDRGTEFTGSYSLTDVVTSDGGTVYYTTTDPSQLSDDPADASNGAANDISGNTVGWTTTKPQDASAITAVRVIAGELLPGETRSFQVEIETQGATGGDTYVNRAQGRAANTELVMRTSAETTVSQYYAYDLKKYVMGADGQWHDAQDENEADWPMLAPDATAQYKFVVTNTGQGDLTDITVTDEMLDTEWTIDELASGDSVESEVYDYALDGVSTSPLQNVACAEAELPADSTQEELVNPCDEANLLIGAYTVSKTADPVSETPVKAGDTITYQVQVTHLGEADLEGVSVIDDLSDVLDDATYNDDATSTSGAVAVEDGQLVWTGNLAKGDVVDITYSVTVTDGGDNRLHNVATPGDDRGTCVPAEDENPDCETTHPKSSYVMSKTVDPAPDASVQAGEVVTYTLTFENTGEAPVEVDAVDHLDAVLDDAVLNADDITSELLTVTHDETQLLITGTLDIGESTTVTYEVTPKVDGERTDSQLVNFLTPKDEEPPEDGVCEPAEDELPTCTTTPVESSMLLEKRGQGPMGVLPLAGAQFEITTPTGETMAVTDEATAGTFLVEGLTPGSYTITETKAPEGYTLLAEPIEFEVLASGAVSAAESDSVEIEHDGNGTWRLILVNLEDFALPMAGGAGTHLWIIGGLLLAASALTIPIIRSKRK